MVSTQMNHKLLVVGALTGFVLTGCLEKNQTPEGLRLAMPNGGSEVVFDVDARPLPEIPFPNDIAMLVDPTSPTGLRLNVSMIAPTDLESEIRGKANRLDGFGTFGPINVQFTRPLNLQNILQRHNEPVPDFSNDAVYLVNVDPRSDEFGRFEVLDLGKGNYPVTMKVPNKYFDFDNRAMGTNLVFESVQEVDLNGNGILDPYEDTDDDGVWDTPNTLDPGADPLDPGQMVEFYERESDTLIIRTLDALKPGTRYAVVLTSALLDEDGNAINSPFKYINHTRQTQDLEPLRQILPNAFPERFNAQLDGVRFAWSFTTQSSTLELETIRAGLYGHGPMSWLGSEFPAEMNIVHRIKGRENSGESALVTKIPQVAIQFIIDALAGGLTPEGRNAMVKSFDNIDYFISGTMVTPYFLVDRDGLIGTPDEIAKNQNLFDDDESFDVDVNTGRAAVGKDLLSFWCSIPKTTESRKPPFPVVIYGHGYGSGRVEMLGFAGAAARLGLASCGLDAAGHGVILDDNFKSDPAIPTLLRAANLENLVDVLEHNRARDLNNDGLRDSGGDFWTADIFHTRDIVRQTVVDHMQFIRMLRSWDGVKKFPDSPDQDDPFVRAFPQIVAGFDATGNGRSEIAGDFNGDGIVDLGSDQPYYIWGQSLGGIVAPIVAGIDPAVRATAPVAGGAGLLDIGYRSSQGGVPEAVILPVIGPALIGRPELHWNAEAQEWRPSGNIDLEWLVTSVNRAQYIRFATLNGMEEGDRIVLRNLRREERPELVESSKLQSRTVVRNGSFRTSIATSAIGANERRHALGFDVMLNANDLFKRKATPEAGLNAEYFRRRDGRAHPADRTRIADLNLDFTGSLPIDGVNPGTFSARIEGQLIPPVGGRYTFRVEVVGRAEVFVNGSRIIQANNNDGSGAATLGESAHIRVEYFSTGTPGTLKVYWSAEDLAEQPIPASAFRTHAPLTSEELGELNRRTITSLGTDARSFGDPIVIEIYRADGTLKQRLDTFQRDTIFENIVYPAGSPLAALRDGYGLKRQTPDFRRFLGLAQHLVDAADPAVYVRKFHRHPLQFPYESNPNFRTGETNALYVPTTGDSAVPVSTGYAMARVGGVLDYRNLDPRYGKTANQYLADNFVFEGVYWLDRFPTHPQALFDHDDLDNGLFISPRLPERGFDVNVDAAEPLRATIQTSRGVSAMRVPYLNEQGEHGFFLPDPTMPFDIDSFMANQIALYFAYGGEQISDDPCLAVYDLSACPWYHPETWAAPKIE